MENPILSAVAAQGFVPLGWFRPRHTDGVPPLAGGDAAAFVLLIGNAGPGMFDRFARERDPQRHSLDDWCRDVLCELAAVLDAEARFPFDKPALPFLTWARRAGSGHVSPLGLNIHPRFGLWHAFRAAFLFPVDLGLPLHDGGRSPCDGCLERPCLTACPVGAFSPQHYDVETCSQHLASRDGADCINRGCRARHACPIGRAYRYSAAQASFHMAAFVRARCI